MAAGGALGSLSRYWVGTIASPLAKQVGFPFGTLTVNLIGCLLIGIYFGVHARGLPDFTRLLLVVGFLGGFTTFSSFSYETVELIQGAQFGLALVNVLVQCSLGLLLVWVGTLLARLLG